MGTLETGYGFWNAIVWVISAIILLLVIFWLRSFGETSYKKGTEQTKPFLSGNPEVEKVHIGGTHVYWGFMEALERYYKTLIKSHTGIINDYFYWVVFVFV